jgi:TPR repeat protein
MDNLGWHYQNGRGVTQDDAQAVAWYRKAAEKGRASAMNNLGWMFEQGRGVVKNIAEAVLWYRQAEALGNEGAKANLKRLGN